MWLPSTLAACARADGGKGDSAMGIEPSDRNPLIYPYLLIWIFFTCHNSQFQIGETLYITTVAMAINNNNSMDEWLKQSSAARNFVCQAITMWIGGRFFSHGGYNFSATGSFTCVTYTVMLGGKFNDDFRLSFGAVKRIARILGLQLPDDGHYIPGDKNNRTHVRESIIDHRKLVAFLVEFAAKYDEKAKELEGEL